MLDTNDDTWEPLIKAVAERENSHPDIIRKNVPGVPANAAPGFFGVPDTYRPAVQMQMNPVDGHNYTVAAQNRKQARELLAAQRVAEADRRLYNAQQAGERPRIRDLAQTGQKGAALGQGLKDVGNIGLGLAAGGAYGLGSALGMTQGGREAYGKFGRGVVDAGKAAGGYLARKFPGVKDRMGRFMQGIKAAPGAFKDYMGERRDLREGRARRELLESGASRRQDYSNRMVPGSEGYDQQMKNYDRGMMQRYFPDGLPKYPEGHEKAGQTMTVDDALRSEISDIGTQQANRRGFRGALRDRMDPGVDVSVEGIDIDEPLAGVSDPMLDADATPPEAEEAPSSVTFTSKPEEEAPPETQAGPPTPVEPDVAEVTEPEMDDPAIAFGDEMAGLAGYKSGGSRRKAAEIARGMFDNKPASYEEIVAATGKAGYRSKLANAIAEYHGISPTQAVQVVQAADAGNPQAQEVVEEAANKSPISFESKPDDDDDEDPVGAGLMELSEDKHHASWDSLLKGLNIR